MSEPEFEIINVGSMIQVKSASAKSEQYGTILSLKVTRKNYALLPTGAHIDIAVCDSDGNSLESISINISGRQFRHSITGRYRPDYVHREIDTDLSKISRVRITSYSQKHQNHES